ncbi:hypothetical protein PM082_021814 [Marasmius tenuissimus]|nr:hypothetical protein PM082_021814 [Marasmius tenuissimus]
MNTRRTPPPSHSKPASHQVAQPPHSTTSPSLTQKSAASSSAQGTRRSPVESPGSQPAQSLPSIRDHLHPYLPPAPPDSGSSGLVALPPSATPAFGGGYPFQPYGSAPGPSHLPQPPHPPQSGSGYPYSHQPPPPPLLGYARAAPQHPLHSRVDDSEDDEPTAGPSRRPRTFSGGRVSEGVRESREIYDRERGEDHGGEGSGMDLDTEGPPKKKRRRQALSCTECKRRKIKCDRSQPCAPCTRRGEQAKCQWHIVEPVEKYISRHEFDELKARLEYLESIVLRGAGHPQAFQIQQPGYPPSVQSGPGSSHPQHPPQSLHSPPTQSLPSHHTSIPGVAGPPPAQPPPSLGIHHLLSGAPPSPTRSPILPGSRAQRDSERERERELRHARSSPIVGFSSRDRKVPSESLSNIPPPLPGMPTEPRRMGHQHSLSSSSVGSAYGQESSGKSPSSSAATVKGRRRSRSPR